MKHCIITGGNSGIGYQAALQIAKKGYAVTLICRNEERAKDACNKITQVTKGVVDYIVADLSKISDVKNAVNIYLSTHKTLDVLINNAADFDLSIKSPIMTNDGLEKQFATNVVAPYLLSKLLLKELKDGRIINISSQGLCMFPFMKLDFNNLNGEKSYSASKTYYQNKLALLMFSLYMNSQQKEVKIQAVRVTNVKVDINRYNNISNFLKKMYKIKSKFSISPGDMAKVYTTLATEDSYNGFYYNEKMKEVKANKFAYDSKEQKKLIDFLDKIIEDQ